MSMAKRILCCGEIIALAFVASASAQQQGRGGIGFGSPIGLAAQEPVQKDLGVSSDTAGKLNSLVDDYVAARRKAIESAGIILQGGGGAGLPVLSNEQRQKITAIGDKLHEEFNSKVKELLSADQFKRLKQIHLQTQGSEAFTDPEVAAELKLSDEQNKKLTDLQAEYGQKMQGLRGGGGGNFQEIGAKRIALNSERNKKAVELLNAEQMEKFAALKGSPFDTTQLGFGCGRGKRGKN
jgi:hypothetical protein